MKRIASLMLVILIAFSLLSVHITYTAQTTPPTQPVHNINTGLSARANLPSVGTYAGPTVNAAAGWSLQWSSTYGGGGHSQFAQPCGDLDGDGVNEIVVGGYENSGIARILKYDKALGTYRQVYSWTEGGGTYNSPSGATMLDLYNNGSLELVMSWAYCGANDGIWAYKWNGITLTKLGHFYCSMAFDVYSCDFDSDGVKEVVVANAPWGGYAAHVIGLGWNKLTSKFYVKAQWMLAGYSSMECSMVWSGDIKGNGKTEIVACISDSSTTTTAGTWALTWNAASSTWTAALVYAGLIGGGIPFGVAVGDVDGDGIAEIGIGNNVAGYVGAGAVLVKWNGATYSTVWTGSWPSEYTVIEGVAIGDGESIGKNQFYVGGGNVHVISWTGTGYAQQSTITGTFGLISGVNIGDFNNDGQNEIKFCDILGYGPGNEWIYKYASTTITYTLTISAGTGGTTNPAPGTYSYAAGSVVNVLATPNVNCVFNYWVLSNVNVGSANPITVTMNANQALNAVFGSGFAYTNKLQYAIGTTVIVGFQNTGSTTITMPNSAPWVILDASGSLVYSPLALQVLTPVLPGQNVQWSWNQKDNSGTQVSSGTYTLLIMGSFTATFSISVRAQGVLYGSTGTGLITIDTNTGAGSLVGSFGIQTAVWGLEFDSGNNILYGATHAAANPNGDGQLLTISRTTGTATPVGGLIGYRVEGLAYDSVNNILYGCTYPGNNLVIINTSTGKGTVVGSGIGFPSLEGLAFNPLDGKLYSVNVGNGALIQIEPSTGKGTVVAQISSGWEQIRGLSFDSSGTLYGAYQPFTGASTHLVIINISTDETEFKHNIYEMRKILLSSGWTDNNIIFLTRSDVAKQETNEPWIDGDATYQNVGKALNAIAYGGTCSFTQTGGSLGTSQSFTPSGPNDIVFIELRDHGGQSLDGWRPVGMTDPNPRDEADGMDGEFCTYDWNNRDWNPANYWYDDEFALKLNNIQCGKLALMVDACHSGEFIPECSGPGRLIITSCAEGQTSYRTAYVFYQRIVDPAADGCGPNGIKDGKISVQEAHYYAVSQVSQLQNPQISDQIGGQFYLDPPNNPNSAEQSDVEAGQQAQNQPQTLLNSSHVLINEFFYNYTNLQEPLQWVELYNPTGTSIDLSGWVLAFDSIDGINLFPPGIIIGPGQYLIVTHDSEAFSEKYTIPPGVRVIDDDQMGNNLGAPPKDTLRLYDATHFNVVDHLDYGGGPGRAPAVAPPNSIARYKGGFDTKNSQNDWYVETKPTPGSENPQEYTHTLGNNVAVLNVTASKTVIGKGFTSNVTFFAANKGDYPETFNVTAYYHDGGTISEPIEVCILSLNSLESTNVTFTWNTTGFAYGNYTISCCAGPVPGETDTSDNNCTMSLTVTIPGDINGDFKVGLPDLVILAQAYGSRPSDSNWNPNADVDGNGAVGLSDLVTLAQHYGQHYP